MFANTPCTVRSAGDNAPMNAVIVNEPFIVNGIEYVNVQIDGYTSPTVFRFTHVELPD